MEIRPLSDLGGVEVVGVDLKGLTPGQGEQLKQLFDEQALVVFRGQSLTKQELIAVGAPFGGAMIDRPATALDPDAPGVSTLSSRGADGDVLPENPDEMVGKVDWHTDEGYVPTPTRGKLLYAVVVPEEGGLTGFIDGRATYRALSDQMKARVQGLHVVQSWNRIQAELARSRRYRRDGETALADNRYADVVYPLVYPHPLSGEMVLNLPRLWAAGIVELAGQAGQDLIDELLAHITQPKHQYWHRYQPGDAVLWDNWCFVHAASGTAGRFTRTMWSITFEGDARLGRLIDEAA